jgi:hypothetical protein
MVQCNSTVHGRMRRLTDDEPTNPAHFLACFPGHVLTAVDPASHHACSFSPTEQGILLAYSECTPQHHSKFMQLTPFANDRPGLPAGRVAASREGRDCDRSHRLTVLLLFPRLDALPGPWLLFLTAVCSFVAVRALELGHF